MDVISKPVVPYIVLKRVQSVIELFQARKRLRRTVASQQTKLLAQVEKIIRLNQGMIEALSTAIEFRSEESGDHVRRIHDITWNLLTYTALGDGLTAKLSSRSPSRPSCTTWGKDRHSDAILNKPGKLTAEEYEVMKTHNTTAGALLSSASPSCAKQALRLRRRHCPPSPRALDGCAIPTDCAGMQSAFGRRPSLADVYDALINKRV